MNLKINKEQHNRLCKAGYQEFIFGSQLHGIADENSDEDYIRIYYFDDVFKNEQYRIESKLPNIHSFQYDDIENNKQYVWMSEEQFWRNLWSGDGNMVADVVLMSGKFKGDELKYCRTQKIIKGYLGVAKRDLKLHGNNEKKKFHAYRSLMMAEKLLNNILPTKTDIINLKKMDLPSKDFLLDFEKQLRRELNSKYDNNEITLYPIFKEEDNLLNLLYLSNNIKEFKY